jgi:hypothetical protein
MPNISETSVSDISLSPGWSVMITFLLLDRTHEPQSLGRSGKRLGRTARPGLGQTTVKDLSREATAGGRKATTDRPQMTSLEDETEEALARRFTYLQRKMLTVIGRE